MTKLLFFAGSARKASINKRLAQLAERQAASIGLETTYVDLRDFEMPLYDGDLEQESGLPENAKAFKKIFCEHQGFFIASPEFNSSMTPLLKNTLDWISRPHEEGEGSLIAFRGKVAALGAASPGGLGGLRGLVSLRMMLGNIGVHVIPTQVAVGNGFQAFQENGALKDAKQAQMLHDTIDEFVSTAKRLS